MAAPFSPREFLQCRNAVLVHFSTLMTRHPELIFPQDLHNAIALKGVALSFSTILMGDTFRMAGGRGGAEGSVGIIADIGPHTSILAVGPSDIGSNDDGSSGLPPTEESCVARIDRRRDSNEWRVRDYVPIGIMILCPILVRQALNEGEVHIELHQVVGAFPSLRIFSVNDRAYLEWDRQESGWKAIAYDEIIRRTF
jgi:hypothetical protein